MAAELAEEDGGGVVEIERRHLGEQLHLGFMIASPVIDATGGSIASHMKACSRWFWMMSRMMPKPSK